MKDLNGVYPPTSKHLHMYTAPSKKSARPSTISNVKTPKTYFLKERTSKRANSSASKSPM